MNEIRQDKNAKSAGMGTDESLVSWDGVIVEESRRIREQRRVRFGERADVFKEDAGAVGLALSGGGIRSATFALGVIQALQELKVRGGHRVLDCVDYLSTVSGGGYIGAWLAANRSRNGRRDDDTRVDEKGYASVHGSPSINHLRRYSRYLAPEAGITSADTWTMVTIWLRNTALIQAVVFSLLVAAIMLASGWLPLFEWMSEATFPEWVNQRFPFERFDGARPFPYIIVQGLLLLWAGARCAGEVKKCARHQVKDASDQGSAQWIAILTLLAAMVGAAGLYWWVLKNQGNVFSRTESWIYAGGLAGIATWLVIMSQSTKEDLKIRWERALLMFGAVTVSNLGLFYAVVELMTWMRGLRLLPCAGDWEAGLAAAAVWGPVIVTMGFAMVLVLCLGLMGRHIEEHVREWWSRLGAWILIYAVVFFLVTGAAIWGPVMMDYLSAWMAGWARDSAIVAWLGATVASLLAGKSEKTGGRGQMGLLARLTSFLPLFVVAGLVIGAAWFARWFLMDETAPDGRPYPFLHSTAGSGSHYALSFSEWGPWAAMFAAIGVILAWRIDINEFSMNPFYRNRLVRCYLGATRRGSARKPHPFTGFDFRDDMLLADLDAENPSGPYPLVNTAMNTASGGDLDAQERMAESFLLSPMFCGFQRRRAVEFENREPSGKTAIPPSLPPVTSGGLEKTNAEKVLSEEKAHLSEEEIKEIKQGYRRTSTWMTKRAGSNTRDGITLGTAMSISGAAASPNSGYHTSPLVAFLMTIFNARLGWWAPHPAMDRFDQVAPKPPFGFLSCLILELFGMATPKKPFVYLSDGGHFENLGIYELIRRRCRFIIAVDAEQDGAYSFHALGTAIRRCRVDFGAHIEINVEAIRPPETDKASKAHCAVGEIRYSDGKTGTLLYLKSSLTGDEDTDVIQYAHGQPLFPHESTGDQFFSESQFESYRKLGRHAAESALKSALERQEEKAKIADTKQEHLPSASPVEALHPPLLAESDPISQLAEDLRAYWYRPASSGSRAFVNHADSLAKLWTQFAKDNPPHEVHQAILPNLGSFTEHVEQVVPGLNGKSPESLYYAAQQMIQLMENVYLDLDMLHDRKHPDNAGWVALFKEWVASPLLQEAWEESKHTYGDRFQAFWEDLKRNHLLDQIEAKTSVGSQAKASNVNQGARVHPKGQPSPPVPDTDNAAE